MNAPSVGQDQPSAFGHRPHLDGLRTVAVYLVVLFHAGADRFTGGFIGVDLFFVLSGYLVTQVMLSDLWSPAGTLSLRNFYSRRVRRLLPAAVVTLLGTALLYSVVASPIEAKESVDSFLSAFLYVSNWHFIREASDYFASDIETNPVLHFWSLSIEEQFYFVWPLALVGLTAASRRIPHGRNVARVVVLCTALASAAWAIHLAQSSVSRAYYGSDPRAYQLLAGALLAMTPKLAGTVEAGARQLVRPRVASAVSLASLVALVLLGTSTLGVGPITRGLLATAVTLALLVALEVSAPVSPVRRLLSTAPFTYLGQISYGTYLWHWPVIVVLTRVLPVSPLATAAITFGVATGLAALSSQLLERPIRTAPVLQRIPRTVALGGVASSVVIGLLLVPAILEPDTEASTVTATALSTVDDAPRVTADIDDVDWLTASQDKLRNGGCVEEPVSNCAKGSREGPRILVIGDSHGIMVQPAFEAIAERRGYSLFVAAMEGCSWHLGLATRSLPADTQRACYETQKDWYDRVIPEVDPDLVVLIQRGIDDPDYPLDLYGQTPDLEGLDQSELLQRTAEDTFSALAALDQTVVVMESIPLTQTDPITCLSTADRVEQCRYVAFDGVTPLERFYRKSASEEQVTVNMDRLVCPYLPICDPVVEDRVVKVDKTHLTTNYATAINEGIERLLDAAGVLP